MISQALEDVVLFANNFTLPSGSPAASRLLSKDALQAPKTPWIFIGGSYPGARAAMLRVRNPDTIFASWASSAPVQAQVNMASYYEAVQRGLPKNCSADYAVAVKFADDALSGGNATLAGEVKLLLAQAAALGSGSNSVTQSDVDAFTAYDAAETLGSSFANFQARVLIYHPAESKLMPPRVEHRPRWHANCMRHARDLERNDFCFGIRAATRARSRRHFPCRREHDGRSFRIQLVFRQQRTIAERQHVLAISVLHPVWYVMTGVLFIVISLTLAVYQGSSRLRTPAILPPSSHRETPLSLSKATVTLHFPACFRRRLA
jgi:hypothetical protein